jgi:hypothetical protein
MNRGRHVRGAAARYDGFAQWNDEQLAVPFGDLVGRMQPVSLSPTFAVTNERPVRASFCRGGAFEEWDHGASSLAAATPIAVRIGAHLRDEQFEVVRDRAELRTTWSRL